jgi:hypothetical protein
LQETAKSRDLILEDGGYGGTSPMTISLVEHVAQPAWEACVDAGGNPPVPPAFEAAIRAAIAALREHNGDDATSETIEQLRAEAEPILSLHEYSMIDQGYDPPPVDPAEPEPAACEATAKERA